MGTRHQIKIIVDGEAKVSQYGQWDGYPTGQGADIAQFIQERLVNKPKNIARLKNNVRAVSALTEEEIEQFNKDHPNGSWIRSHPWLSRDCGANILKHLYDGDLTKVLFDKETPETDKTWIEYWYVINLDDETVSVNGRKKIPFTEWTVEKMKRLR